MSSYKAATFFNRVAPDSTEVESRATASGTVGNLDLSGSANLGSFVKTGELFGLICDTALYFSLSNANVTIDETQNNGATACALLPANTLYTFHFHTPTGNEPATDKVKYVFNWKGTATGRWRIFRMSRGSLN